MTQSSIGSHTRRGSPYYDGILPGLLGIDVVHHQVHEGQAFSASFITPDASPIADNATTKFQITTGTNAAHMAFNIAFEGYADYLFYEGSTSISGGTGMTERCMNRNGTDSNCTTKLVSGVTATEGDLLEAAAIPGGTGGGASGRGGGSARTGVEWLLKPSTEYTLNITNRSGGNAHFSVVFEWYEQPSGDVF